MSAGYSSLINIFNPEVIIIGSWVTDLLGQVILPDLLNLVEKQSLAQPFRAVKFALSDMSRNPVGLGAATLVLEEFLVKNGRQSAQLRNEGIFASQF
jgi:predicted NBD/HSP70 family sugar kinase